ncbi:hypothetical protein C8Q74DRAFT_55402 [Fomes fomentarius]|nr:hypothetical protein C8Q74DRAFT_55402 [Fomes fomentarius]
MCPGQTAQCPYPIDEVFVRRILCRATMVARRTRSGWDLSHRRQLPPFPICFCLRLCERTLLRACRCVTVHRRRPIFSQHEARIQASSFKTSLSSLPNIHGKRAPRQRRTPSLSAAPVVGTHAESAPSRDSADRLPVHCQPRSMSQPVPPVCQLPRALRVNTNALVPGSHHSTQASICYTVCCGAYTYRGARIVSSVTPGDHLEAGRSWRWTMAVRWAARAKPNRTSNPIASPMYTTP